jgi:hypothetical protein
MKRIVLPLLTIVSFALGSTAQVSAPRFNHQLAVGMTFDDVIASWGQPERVVRATYGAVEFWFMDLDRHGILVEFNNGEVASFGGFATFQQDDSANVLQTYQIAVRSAFAMSICLSRFFVATAPCCSTPLVGNEHSRANVLASWGKPQSVYRLCSPCGFKEWWWMENGWEVTLENGRVVCFNELDSSAR